MTTPNVPDVIEGTSVARLEEGAMSPDDIEKQVNLIQQVMKKVMKKGEHYGRIPGSKKDILFKPGAEKLSTVFRLSPTYILSETDLPDGHRECKAICTLTHIPSGKVFGQGVGSCSTMESKYRYRTEIELTGKPVPKAYWADRDQSLIGGLGYKPKKIDDRWEIVKIGDRIENEDLADVYNTVLKMAKKRAHVDAVLTATAASDIFTQDIEDMPSEALDGEKVSAATKQEQPPKDAPSPDAPDLLHPPDVDDADLPEVTAELLVSAVGFGKTYKEHTWANMLEGSIDGKRREWLEWLASSRNKKTNEPSRNTLTAIAVLRYQEQLELAPDPNDPGEALPQGDDEPPDPGDDDIPF